MIGLSIAGAILVIVLGIYAQYYRMLVTKLIEYALNQEQWIDDIIKALEVKDEEEGNVKIDNLIDAKRTPERGPLD